MKLVFAEGASRQFWEAEVVDSDTLVVRFGRLGTSGHEKRKRCGSTEAAHKVLAELANEKRAKGYVVARGMDESGDATGSARAHIHTVRIEAKDLPGSEVPAIAKAKLRHCREIHVAAEGDRVLGVHGKDLPVWLEGGTVRTLDVPGNVDWALSYDGLRALRADAKRLWVLDVTAAKLERVRWKLGADDQFIKGFAWAEGGLIAVATVSRTVLLDERGVVLSEWQTGSGMRATASFLGGRVVVVHGHGGWHVLGVSRGAMKPLRVVPEASVGIALDRSRRRCFVKNALGQWYELRGAEEAWKVTFDASN